MTLMSHVLSFLSIFSLTFSTTLAQASEKSYDRKVVIMDSSGDSNDVTILLRGDRVYFYDANHVLGSTSGYSVQEISRRSTQLLQQKQHTFSREVVNGAVKGATYGGGAGGSLAFLISFVSSFASMFSPNQTGNPALPAVVACTGVVTGAVIGGIRAHSGNKCYRNISIALDELANPKINQKEIQIWTGRSTTFAVDVIKQLI